MRLSDIMGNMNLSIFPQIGLVMFLSIFAVVVYRIVRKENQAQYEAARFIPLSDAPDATSQRSESKSEAPRE